MKHRSIGGALSKVSTMASISGIGSTSTTLPTGTAGTTSGSSNGGSGTGNTLDSTSTGSGLVSSAGIGSGLDVNSIITALVNAKQAGPSAQINAQTTQLQAQEAGLTALSSSLTGMQSSLSKLASNLTFQSWSGALGDTTMGTVSTLPNAQAGTYNLNVTQLATAQSRVSEAFATGATPGAGTLTLTVGGNAVNVTVGANDSLSAIATSINQASGNPGVQATVVYGSAGAQLLLTSTKTGVANGFTVTAGNGSSAGLSALATTLNTAGTNEAQDAQFTLNGIAASSASNQASGVLDGVTLNLAKTGSTTLTVSQDTSAATQAVNDFVSAYNSYVGTVGTLASYDPTSQQAGVLLGDSTLMSVQRQINAVLSGSVPGNTIGSLAALGVTRQADGTLQVDSSKLSSALTSNPGAVQNLFAGSNGYATSLNNLVTSFTGGNGVISSRITSIQGQLTNLGQQSTALQARMNVYATQLRQQYTALDTLMSSLNNTSSYLTNSLQALMATYTNTGK